MKKTPIKITRKELAQVVEQIVKEETENLVQAFQVTYHNIIVKFKNGRTEKYNHGEVPPEIKSQLEAMAEKAINK